MRRVAVSYSFAHSDAVRVQRGASRERCAVMAQKVTVALVDDLSGTQADETVAFALDGKSYEIDLSNGNAENLRGILADYVAAARRPAGNAKSHGPAKTPRSSVDRDRNQAVREWARKRGMQLSERGRIPAEVLESYNQEN